MFKSIASIKTSFDIIKIQPIPQNEALEYKPIKVCIYSLEPARPEIYRGFFVYNICLISVSNTVSDGATNKSVLNIERSYYD